MKKKENKFLKEFKEFAVRGNVVDLAIGVVVGAAFGAVTSSLVSDIITPIIGIFIGGINIEAWTINVPNFIYGKEAIPIFIGRFLSSIINLIIIAFVMFLVVKAMNTLKKKQEKPAEKPAEPVPTKEELLLGEIRDLLKNK